MIKFFKKFLRYLLDNLTKKKITKIIQNNQEFFIETRDKLGEEWNLINNYEYSEFQIFKSLVKSEKIKNVFYFGAHQCVIPIKIHKIFLKDSNFFCFEAIKKNFLIGSENIKLNKCETKIKVFNEAISINVGHDYFDSISLNSYKTDKSFFSSKVKSLDLESIITKYGKGELLYFDIEGLEGRVIEKSINFLKSWKNNLFVEAHGTDFTKRYDYTNKKLFKLLTDNGYKFYKLKDDYQENVDKFIEINDQDQIPEKRFYFFAHN